ncbi:MAG: hypothetical protein M3Y82_05265, partial [Verrucomicrobiota bacterium]|nr:hypothetical protein [Verrucomicrobiota bacterium]
MDSEKFPRISRREFIGNSILTAAALALGELPATAQTNVLGADDSKPLASLDKNARHLRVVMREADGSAISSERLALLHARDLANDPLPQAISSAEGRARIGLAKEPFQLSARLKVPGFGEVYCYADNSGKGYSKQDNIEFVVEAAATRLRRVREYLEKNPGLPADAEFEKHLAAAAKTISKKAGAEQIAQAYEVL